MGIGDQLRRLFEPPTIEISSYRCVECDAPLGPREETCPDCGGEVVEGTDTIEYTYWGPHQ